MTQFLFKSCLGNESRLKKLTEVSNYDKFICNIFGRDTEKIRIIRAKVQIIVWIENGELSKSFFYMCGESKFVIGEM